MATNWSKYGDKCSKFYFWLSQDKEEESVDQGIGGRKEHTNQVKRHFPFYNIGLLKFLYN
jgi:hypothetical protein